MGLSDVSSPAALEKKRGMERAATVVHWKLQRVRVWGLGFGVWGLGCVSYVNTSYILAILEAVVPGPPVVETMCSMRSSSSSSSSSSITCQN